MMLLNLKYSMKYISYLYWITLNHSKRQILMRSDIKDHTDYEKLEKMDAAVDRIRGRYGIDSVKRAAFLNSQIDHMSGRISREKRTVDYKKIKVN